MVEKLRALGADVDQVRPSSAAGPDGPTAELLLTLLTPALEILILRYFDTRIPDTFDQRLRRPQWTSLLPPTYNYCTGYYCYYEQTTQLLP